MAALNGCPKCDGALMAGRHADEEAYCLMCGYIKHKEPPKPNIHSRNTPYGKRRHKDGYLIDDLDERKILRLALKMAETRGLSEVATRLTSLGHRNRAGKPFTASSIAQMKKKYGKKEEAQVNETRGDEMDKVKAGELRARLHIIKGLIDLAPDILDVNSFSRDYEGVDALLAQAQSQLSRARKVAQDAH